MYSPLPAHTNDNYTNYFIGFDNGANAADKENQHSTVYYHDNCGTDHTNEYCVGFKAANDFIFSPLLRLRIVAYVRNPFLANVKDVS